MARAQETRWGGTLLRSIHRRGPQGILAVLGLVALTSAGCNTSGATISVRHQATVAHLSSTASAVSNSCPRIGCIVRRAIPGATVFYGPHHYGPRDMITLDIRQPASTRPPVGTKIQKIFAYSQNGWVAAMASYLAATRNSRIGGYQLLPHRGHLTRAAFDYYQRPVSADPTNKRIGQPKLDSLAVSAAVKQVRASLRRLRSLLPVRSIRRSRIDIISFDPAREEYALSVTLTVARADDLDGHIGDLVLGLTSGLIGEPSSLIEGLAVVASTPTRPLAGSWQTIRNDTGNLEFAPTIHYSCFQTTATFPDLTGGPRVHKGDGFCHG